ncbi:6-carboxytetrahydropterin synthase, partial [bacterium]|nr:6-carboxytetrahydropterin synthase [bacterium]
METIRVISDFHAAHRQLGYDGKCRYVHGHTWVGTFVLKAERFPRNRLDMSIDFGRLKDILRHLDHKMLVSEQDEVFLRSGLFEPEGVVLIPGD